MIKPRGWRELAWLEVISSMCHRPLPGDDQDIGAVPLRGDSSAQRHTHSSDG